MSTVTTSGSGTLTTLVVSTGTNVIVPQFQYASLLQDASVSVTGNDHTVLILGRVQTTNNAQCSVEIYIDGVEVYQDAAGGQIIARMTLSAGSHVMEFKAFALANDVQAEMFGLTVIDLGL